MDFKMKLEGKKGGGEGFKWFLKEAKVLRGIRL